MEEYHSPLLEEPTGNLADLVATNAAEAPDAVVFRRRRGPDAPWSDVTCRDFQTEVRAVAKGLVAAGVRPGDRVGLMAKTRYEWTLIDFAVWTAGGVVVPVYETSSAEQLQWVLKDSGAVACVVESARHASLLDQLRGSLPDLRWSWTIDEGAVTELSRAGTDVADDDLDRRRSQAGLDDLATIIYTSGTTGAPKGCELTHGNFLAGAANVISSADPPSTLADVVADEDASTLLFLPLAHVFARLIEVAVFMARGTLGHTADVSRLLDDLAGFRPTFVLAVPRVFEKVYNGAEQKAEAGGRGKVFAAAAATAIAWSEAADDGGPGLGLRLKHALFDRLVYGKLRAALGGRVRWAISGGAPLGARLGHFYRGIGLTVLEGYGLTETTAASTVNTPGHVKIGSVGRPIPGGAARITEDGEVLVRGVHVFRGYHGKPDATREAFVDGWFRTGDIGKLDGDGFLHITGRKKEIIVTSSGKNVAPAVLEDRIRAARLVGECMVVGDAQPYVACLVTLDAEALAAWADQHGKPGMTTEQAAQDPDVRAEVQKAIDDANAAVSRAEAIKKFTILPVHWTEDNGFLTPSLKLKRGVVLKEHSADIDGLYS